MNLKLWIVILITIAVTAVFLLPFCGFLQCRDFQIRIQALGFAGSAHAGSTAADDDKAFFSGF